MKKLLPYYEKINRELLQTGSVNPQGNRGPEKMAAQNEAIRTSKEKQIDELRRKVVGQILDYNAYSGSYTRFIGPIKAFIEKEIDHTGLQVLSEKLTRTKAPGESIYSPLVERVEEISEELAIGHINNAYIDAVVVVLRRKFNTFFSENNINSKDSRLFNNIFIRFMDPKS